MVRITLIFVFYFLLGENWCLSLLGLGFFFVQEMKQESYSVCVGGRGLGGERKVFSLPWISVPFSDSGTWFLMPGRLDSSGHPCCLLNSFIYLNFMYFTIVTSKWTELIANLPQEPQAIKPSKFSEYFVFMSQRLSTLVSKWWNQYIWNICNINSSRLNLAVVAGFCLVRGNNNNHI